MAVRKTRVLIVGAGTCGSVLANRLSANDTLAVTLVEAGPDFPPSDRPSGITQSSNPLLTEFDWGYRASLLEEQDGPLSTVHYPRGKLVGGCSAINGAVGTRPTNSYFDNLAQGRTPVWTWAEFDAACRSIAPDPAPGPSRAPASTIAVTRIPETTWPDLFRRIADQLQREGVPWRPDMNAAAGDGIGCTPRTESSGGKSSGLDALIDPVRARENLTVLSDLEVDRLHVDDGGRVVGVWVSKDGVQSTLPADHVVLCAGVIGTPQILWRSGIGDGDDLARVGIPSRHELPAVGKNLADHPRVGMLLPSWRGLAGAKGITTMLRWSSAADHDGDALMFLAVLTPKGAGIEDAPSDDVVLVSCTLASPASRGWVRPTREGRSVGVDIRLNMLATESDRTRLRAIVRRASALVTASTTDDVLDLSALPSTAVLTDDGALDDWIKIRIKTAYHPVGTCSMGDDPLTSVVDQQFAVHGLRGVSIVDASVLPPIPNAPTNVACYALAEHAVRSGKVSAASMASPVPQDCGDET